MEFTRALKQHSLIIVSVKMQLVDILKVNEYYYETISYRNEENQYISNTKISKRTAIDV
jgi:hypothetical protein